MQTESVVKYSYKPSLRTRLEAYFPQLGALTVLLSIFVTAFLIVDGIRNPVKLAVNASGGNATLSFVPDQLVIDSANGGYVKLWVTSNAPVVFAHLVCQFDPTSISLVESIDVKSSPLTRVVDKTKPEIANQKGEIRLALALEPSQRQNPPSDNFELATLHFRGKSEARPSSISCATTTSSLFSLDGELFSLEALEANISVGNETTLSAAPNSTEKPTIRLEAKPESSPTSNTYSADANSDQEINMFDLVVWRDHYLKKGYAGTSAGDFNEDSRVDGADYAIWLAQY